MAQENESVDYLSIQIGSWNMVADAAKTVPHGMDYKRVRGINASILNDGETEGRSLDGGISVDAENVNLARINGGVFDSPNFADPDQNRGWIVVYYAK